MHVFIGLSVACLRPWVWMTTCSSQRMRLLMVMWMWATWWACCRMLSIRMMLNPWRLRTWKSRCSLLRYSINLDMIQLRHGLAVIRSNRKPNIAQTLWIFEIKMPSVPVIVWDYLESFWCCLLSQDVGEDVEQAAAHAAAVPEATTISAAGTAVTPEAAAPKCAPQPAVPLVSLGGCTCDMHARRHIINIYLKFNIWYI